MMASTGEDDGQDRRVSPRTRSKRKVVHTETPTMPRATRSKRGQKQVVVEEAEEFKEMSTDLQNFLEKSEEFDISLAKNDLSKGFEEGNTMDEMIKTCYDNNVTSDQEMMERSVPFKSDISIVDSTNESANVPLKFEHGDDFFDEQKSDSVDASDNIITDSTADNNIEDSTTDNNITESIADNITEASPHTNITNSAIENNVKEERENENHNEDDLSNSSDEPLKPIRKKIESAIDETEVVSEDELPSVVKPEVKDAENVSDDELPGPKPAELPADTEVVSEDELPTTKKESSESGGRKRKASDASGNDYDPGSPTSEGESSSKKAAIAKDGESKPQSTDKKTSEDKSKKSLPELDKHWKAVNEDVTDFTAWTYLLQYVDSESDVEATREAYDAFLSHYPYCYGYWRKYADYEKRKGSKKKCLEALERGLRAIPLSVDLWIHFINHIKSIRADDIDYIRSQYERALDACGLEFRSDRLWESYVKWETEKGTLPNVTSIFDRLLVTPTLGYANHFESFQEHIKLHPPSACIPAVNFLQYRSEVRKDQKSATAEPDNDAPPGEDEPDNHVRNEEEGNLIKEKIIETRRKIHKATVDKVSQRWTYEEGIKRPYFHVKPLERCQLDNWKNYLEWEEQKGDPTRILVLYERCLIACALYEEYWIRLIMYLEGSLFANKDEAIKKKLTARCRDAYERACTIHHTDKPSLHLRWSLFEESQHNITKASEILERIDMTCPNLMQVALRRIGLEKRRGDMEKCNQLYESYLAAPKNKTFISTLAIKYSRHLNIVRRDPEAAIKVLKSAILKEPNCQRLYLQLIDVSISQKDFKLSDIVGFIDEYLAKDVDPELKIAFLQRKLELLEELGDDATEIKQAYDEYNTMYNLFYKKKNQKGFGDPKKKGEGAAPPLPSGGNGSSTAAASSANASYSSYGSNAYNYGTTGTGTSAGAAASYDSSYSAQQYQTAWAGYQQPANPYQSWQSYQNYY